MRQIVAIGGLGSPPAENDLEIYRYLLRQAARQRPSVCFIPTASAESRERILQFYETFSALACRPCWLSLFNLPTADLESYLLDTDIIFVGGGNTRSMLALWREWGLDRILRKAYERGILLAGSSAGANCWFDECTTDSIPGPLTVLPGLGFLKGSFTPHYDVEPARRPTLHRMLLERNIRPGYAADNETALHFVDETLFRAASARANASAYRIGLEAGSVVERPIEVIRLP